MAIDFRDPALERVDGRTESQAPDREDRNVVIFPMHWWALLSVLATLAATGYMAVQYTLSLSGGDTLLGILVGGLILLASLCWLPNSLRIDQLGVHQVHFLGLWERSIASNNVRSFRVATRGDLRREGLLRFQVRWNMRQRGDGEEVVWVGAKSGKRYLLHSAFHGRRSRFIRELQDRGYPEYGYENWEDFMEKRGVPVARERGSFN